MRDDCHCLPIKLPATQNPLRVCVALSGGMDSMVLLHLCLDLLEAGKIASLRAVHVHHGLSEKADQWAGFCESACKKWRIPLTITKVKLRERRRKGLEFLAREVRYQAFEETLQEGDYLFQGHHCNDQSETVIFRLLRGSDSHGLGGIPVKRPLGKGMVYRPLLEVQRSQIENHANAHGIDWVEDESNRFESHDRNFIRHQVIPLLQSRWPEAVASIAEVAANCADAAKLLDEMAKEDMEKICSRITLPFIGATEGISCSLLKKLSLLRQKNALKYWFRKSRKPLPGKGCLDRMINEMIESSQDRHPVICFHGVTVRRYRQWIVMDTARERTAPVPGVLYLEKERFPLVHCGLVFRMEEAIHQRGLGIGKDISKLDITFRSHVKELPPFSIYGRQGKKNLKKWLNELAVPYWIRDCLPLLVHENELVAIPGVLVNDRFCAPEGEKSWKIFSCFSDGAV